jgi:hypothetical protein
MGLAADQWLIVLRPGDGVSAEALGGTLAGTWLDVGGEPPETFVLGGVRAVAADRYETRSDGATARVYEVWPVPDTEGTVLPPGT